LTLETGEAGVAEFHGSFVWYELMTTDVAAAKQFYSKVVGWETGALPSAAEYTVFTNSKIPVTGVLELSAEYAAAGARPHWFGYVNVDDVDTAAARVTQLGGTVRVPPTEVPDVSRFAIVSDPQQAAFALFKGLRAAREPADAAAGTPGRIGWHELFATDWPRAFVFYQALFGWEKADSHLGQTGTYQQFSAAGEIVGGMFNKPEAVPAPFWLYYFNVHGMAEAAGRVKTAGGRILYGPTEVEGGASVVHCADPQGAVFALLERGSRRPVGYFEAGTLGAPSGTRTKRWSW
jgi:uncharacterized protein